MSLSIIPARAGSIGINKKNLRELSGRPLIKWTFDFVKTHTTSDALVITTDDPKIISVCLGEGATEIFQEMQEAEVSKIQNGIYVHKRRTKDAEANSRTVNAVIDLLGSSLLSNYREDWIWLFQPTSPFRNIAELRDLEKIITNAEFDSLISVKEFESPHPLKALEIDQDKFIIENTNFMNLEKPRQELGNFCVPDGAYYISRAQNILKNRSFYGNKNFSYVRRGAQTLNIDTENDFEYAEFIAINSQTASEI